MQDLEAVPVTTNDTNDWSQTSDRDLAEFTANQLVALVAIMGDIRDKMGPAIEKMGPVLSMLGMG